MQVGQTISTVIDNPTERRFYRGYTVRLVSGGMNTTYGGTAVSRLAVGTFEYFTYGRWYSPGGTTLFDTDTDAGLRLVVERAGLRWEEAQAHLDREGWREELEANREQLFALGLWGVPSFRLVGRPGEPDYLTWGQDRLWRVEQEIRKRLAP